MPRDKSNQVIITGLQAFRGEGAPVGRGFWADAWGHVLKQPAAVLGLVWIGVVSFFAIFAPLIASGHPLIEWQIDPATGKQGPMSSPLLAHLNAADWAILVGGVVGIIVMVLPKAVVGGLSRGARGGLILTAGIQAAVSIVLASYVSGYFTARDAPDWARRFELGGSFIPIVATGSASIAAAIFCAVGAIQKSRSRVILSIVVAAALATILALTWRTPPGSFDSMQRERLGEIRAIYTLVPWSSNQRPGDRDAAAMAPGTTHDQALANVVRSAIPPPGMRPTTAADVEAAVRLARQLPLDSETRDRVASDLEQRFGGRDGVTRAQVGDAARETLRGVGKHHLLGTDKFGQDVLAQILHACRLSISMGIVATGLATLIGVTMGSLMGYFGGWVDMLLYRVVEIFMAIPVLFLLIVAAGVLERNTYVMMAIIGCVTWHGAARFTRAEFMKLRSQDFVQSARSVGLPLRSILFKHMLPNGVTPVLVDASFGIAAAIQVEAVLSYLGLGPPDQPSWGRVLADAAGESGTFNWWLGVFPGAAIFLTVLSLTMVGEALRDAIDPKLKKARV